MNRNRILSVNVEAAKEKVKLNSRCSHLSGNKKKIYICCLLGVFTCILGLAVLVFEEGFEEIQYFKESGPVQTITGCRNYKSSSTDFFLEGLTCGECVQESDALLSFGKCEGRCSIWNFNTNSNFLTPNGLSCSEDGTPSDFALQLCPENTYQLHLDTGCTVNSLSELNNLLEYAEEQNYKLLEREDCFHQCELYASCSGVVSFESSCLPLTPEMENFCTRKKTSDVFCSKITDEIECFDRALSFTAALTSCEAQLARVPSQDDLSIQQGRIHSKCGAEECWVHVEGKQVDQCYAISTQNNLITENSCSALLGYCCEPETSSPTSSPTLNPTAQPTFSPSISPSFTPSSSPTNFPTESPAEPTPEPVGPSTSPTISPSFTPTGSPNFFEQLCRDIDPNVYTFVNNYRQPKQLFFLFINKKFIEDPQNAYLRGLPGVYPPCNLEICSSVSDIMIPGYTAVDFIIPALKVYGLFSGLSNSFEISKEDIFLDGCTCEREEFLLDDFSSSVQNVQGSKLHSNWTLNSDSNVQIIEGKECLVGSCMKLDGTLSVSLENTRVEYTNFRMCSFNIWVGGSKVCDSSGGNNADADCIIVKEASRQYNGFSMTMYSDNQIVKRRTFKDISYDQSYIPYGITHNLAELSNSWAELEATSLFLENSNLAGLVFDNSSFICCCKMSLSEFPVRIVWFQQGVVGASSSELFSVQAKKSEAEAILSMGPTYDALFNTPLALGIQGSVVYQFENGFTEFITIYENSFYIPCADCEFGYSLPENNEDATVEVSVDGVLYFLVANSLRSSWQLFEGGDDSIRYAEVFLPNGACFKYIRINDTSTPVNDADDGFDLHAIVAGEVCCLDEKPQLAAVVLPPGRNILERRRNLRFTFTAGVLFVLIFGFLSCLSKLFVFYREEKMDKLEEFH
eukprot:augustus_masked-scaffold_3-processed-gene-7.44-mRNA-1 protein AED:1.00 eAED:1.00 QI:0/-1/0/0/-1/1/1/0/911